VTDTTIYISGAVRFTNVGGGNVVINCAVAGSHFTGTGTIGGVPCTITGRLDLPAASDDEQTDQQAFTGRITATIRDTSGNVARLVGVQSPASRSGGYANPNTGAPGAGGAGGGGGSAGGGGGIQGGGGGDGDGDGR
jgi:hypothetical protein